MQGTADEVVRHTYLCVVVFIGATPHVLIGRFLDKGAEERVQAGVEGLGHASTIS